MLQTTGAKRSTQGIGHENQAQTPLRAIGWLTWREVIRFFRQPNRVVGAVGTPLLFWALFGMGLNRSFQISGAPSGGPSFAEYFLPGTLVLMSLFTAIFSTISVIEDRREGFLQGVLVSPVPRFAIVLSKTFGATIIAITQGLLFLIIGLGLSGAWARPGAIVAVGSSLALLAVASVALTAMGLAIAWRLESTQGFHAVMNLFLMPMWMLSGAFFPAAQTAIGAPIGDQIVHWAIRLNPLSYCVSGVQQMLLGDRLRGGIWAPDLVTCWLVTIGFAALMLLLATTSTQGRVSGDHL